MRCIFPSRMWYCSGWLISFRDHNTLWFATNIEIDQHHLCQCLLMLLMRNLYFSNILNLVLIQYISWIWFGGFDFLLSVCLSTWPFYHAEKKHYLLQELKLLRPDRWKEPHGERSLKELLCEDGSIKKTSSVYPVNLEIKGLSGSNSASACLRDWLIFPCQQSRGRLIL